MTASRQTKKAWGAKLEEKDQAAQKAQEDLLVTIYQARQAGLSQEDVAYHLEKCSTSGVKPKEDKGREILERRRGSKGGSGTP